MSRRFIVTLAFALTVLAGLCHALCYSTMLPDRVATSFDASGVPIAWSSRSTMLDAQLTVIVGVAAGFLVLAGGVLRSPPRWISVPRRDWWLAPERGEGTRQDLALRLLCLGALTQLLLLDLFHRSVRFNLGRTPALESYWLDLGVFGLVAVVWLVCLIWRYRQASAAAA